MSVRNALLALVATRPEGVYRLKQTFEDRTGDTWSLNIGQVYQTMQRLERDGFVTSHQEVHNGRESEVFTLAPSGQEVLERWYRESVPRDRPGRDELVLKVAAAINNPDADIHAILQRQRRSTNQALRAFTRAKEGYTESDISALAVLDRQIFELRAELRWLDSVEARVDKARAEKREPAED